MLVARWSEIAGNHGQLDKSLIAHELVDEFDAEPAALDLNVEDAYLSRLCRIMVRQHNICHSSSALKRSSAKKTSLAKGGTGS